MFEYAGATGHLNLDLPACLIPPGLRTFPSVPIPIQDPLFILTLDAVIQIVDGT
jgi:hypothetical protein